VAWKALVFLRSPQSGRRREEVVVPNNIMKAELLTRVSQISGVSKVDVEKVLDAFFGTAKVVAHRGDQVSWPHFGSFRGRRVPARPARNLHTGERIIVAAHTRMTFTPSSILKQELKAAKAPTVKVAAKKLPAAKKATTKASKKATKKAAKKATKKTPKKAAKKSAKKKTTKKSARGRKR
jgi:nucleoid DNA-binding protein